MIIRRCIHGDNSVGAEHHGTLLRAQVLQSDVQRTVTTVTSPVGSVLPPRTDRLPITPFRALKLMLKEARGST